MAADNSRLEELRRRVQQDPASVVFAQLAEEHRRAGDYDEAVRVCRAGLEQHPAYISARVTLGRALMELGQYDEAKAELEQVMLAAPDNLAALRSMADLHQRRGESMSEAAIAEALSAEALPVEISSAEVGVAEMPPAEVPPAEVPHVEGPPPETPPGEASSAQVAASEPPAVDLSSVEATSPDFETAVAEFNVAFGVQPEDPVLLELEGWLSAIEADRAERDRDRGDARPRRPGV